MRLLCPWDFPGKNTGVGCHALLQRIFPTQGSNPGLQYFRQSLRSEPLGKQTRYACIHSLLQHLIKNLKCHPRHHFMPRLLTTDIHSQWTLSFLTISCSLLSLLLPTSASKIPPSLFMYVKIWLYFEAQMALTRSHPISLCWAS